MALKTCRELGVWQKAMDMVEAIYGLADAFPGRERFGLVSQIRRAAVSVPSNIAEGYGRSHRGDYLHHLSIARGSLAEVETQLLLAVRLGYCQRERALEVWNLCQEVGRMLNKLIKSLEQPGTLNPEPRPLNPKNRVRKN